MIERAILYAVLGLCLLIASLVVLDKVVAYIQRRKRGG